MNWATFKKPIVIAHRGFTKQYLENSLEAVEAALKLGCDGIEVDLRMTADGELVIFHDWDLKRLADREEGVEELTVSGVRDLRLVGGSRIPFLDELLDLVRDQALLNLEIKTVHYFSRDLETKLLQQLHAFHLDETILLSAFNPLPLIRLRKMAPSLHRGTLVSGLYWRTRPRKPLIHWIQPFGIHASHDLMTESFIQKHHQAGRRIFTWTVNDRDVMKKLLAIGADGIFSDVPDEILRALGRLR